MGMLLSRYHNTNSNNNVKSEGVAKTVTPSVEKEKKSKKSDFSFTASEIKAMSGAKLRKVAKDNGISDPEELTVGELKAILTEKAEG